METKQVKEIKIEDYKLQKGLLGSQVVMKLPCMRKAEEFEIYNFSNESKYIEFQADGKCFLYIFESNIIRYSNKGNAPVYFYAGLRPTHLFKVTDTKFIEDVKSFVKSDSRNKADGSTEVLLFG